MKINFVINFFTLWFIIGQSNGEQLQCEYIRHSDGYNCEMKSAFEESKEVTSVIGDHKYGKNNVDVDVFFVTDTSRTKYVPVKVCSFFENLNKFDIYGSNVLEIKKNIFVGCTKVKKIVIKYIKLTTLDEDLFSEVRNLESFVMSFTYVEVLPTKLFDNMQNLKFIDMSYNKLKTITTEFPNTLSMLSLMNNECIDGHFDLRSLSSSTTLIGLIKDVYKKCGALNEGTESNFNLTYNEVQVRLMEEQILKNENKLTSLETDLENLDAEITKKIEDHLKNFKILQQDTNEKLEKTNKAIETLEKNSKDHMEKFFAITNTLTDDARNMKVKMEKNDEFKQISGNLRTEMNRNENLIITLFCFQLAMIAIAIFIGVYKTFYSNRISDVRLINDSAHANF